MSPQSRFVFLAVALIVPACLLITGCGQAVTDAYIDGLIAEGQKQAAQTLNENKQLYSSITMKRDGDENGVVLEHIFAEGVDEVPTRIKIKAINGMKAATSWDQVKPVFDAGIYMRVVFKNADGDVVAEDKITKDDL